MQHDTCSIGFVGKICSNSLASHPVLIPPMGFTILQRCLTFLISSWTEQYLTLCADNGKCFLGLLPPRNAMEADNPLAAQVNYQPRPSDVVPLSDVLQERPSHPRHTLRKALHRLAPTCRLLWCKTPWIVNTIEKVCTLEVVTTAHSLLDPSE